MKQCKFDIAWTGRCQSEAVKNGCCEQHQVKCCSCGQPATHDCPETGQFVCGTPLCNDCEHTIFEDGTNGGIGFNEQPLPAGLRRHCRKNEQRFSPWFTRQEIENR